MEDQFTVTLEGGRPWGFTIQGGAVPSSLEGGQGGADLSSPLRVGKVREIESTRYKPGSYHVDFMNQLSVVANVLVFSARPRDTVPMAS